LIAAIIAKVSPNLDAREFAAHVLEALRRKNVTLTPNGTSVSDLLPSFLTDTVIIETSLKENVAPSNVTKSSVDASFRRKSLVQRHSSPKKQTVNSSTLAINLAKSRLAMSQISTLNTNDSEELSPKTPLAEFPIECNRISVLYIGCQAANQEEQVTIRNILNDQPVLLNLMIRDSADFTFSNEKRTLQLNFEAGEAKKVSISFSSKSDNERWSYGKLVLKPQGLKSASGQKKFRATIPLQGYNGKPEIVYESANFVQRSNNKKLLKIDQNTFEAEIRVANFGSGHGFVRFFSDSSHYSVWPNDFVLKPGERKTVSVSAKESSFISTGRLEAIHGSEIGRLILRKVGNGLSNLERQFVQRFDGEDDLILDGCDPKVLASASENTSSFYNSLDRFGFDVGFFRDYETVQTSAETEVHFHKLLPEETFMTTNSSYQSILASPAAIQCMPKQQQKQVYQQQHQQKQVTHQKMPTSLQQRHMSKQQQMQSVQEGEMELAVFGGLQKTQILRGADFSLYEAKVTR
jgi:hypothetical protein